MEFSQESIATLHDFGDADPPAPVDRATVVVPMTAREFGTGVAERVFTGLERVDPREVIVPLDASAARAGSIAAWLEARSVPVEVLWCAGERLHGTLADAGFGKDGRVGDGGKGRDVWLALGLAGGEYVALHDADAQTYEPRDTRKLLAPLGWTEANAGVRDRHTPALDGDDPGFSFVKGYYARVEHDRLYGRLTRLFYEPVVAALTETAGDATDEPGVESLLDYLGAFRYALAGECAMTADVARGMAVHPRWGFEVGTLAAAFELAGPAGTAQADLGRYEHDHRSVEGPGGLSTVSDGVADALLRAVGERGLSVDPAALRERYRTVAHRRTRAYAADAAFNGLSHDRAAERRQVEVYADAITAPREDPRLPAWRDCALDPAAVRDAARADLEAAVDAAAEGEETSVGRDGPPTDAEA